MNMVEAIRKNAILLALFSSITAGGISLTYLLTKDQIIESIRQAEERSLVEIIPHDRHDNQMLEDSFEVNSREHLGLKDPAKAYVAKQGEEPVGVILPIVAPDGYNGAIHGLVGFYADGSIAGVRVLVHRETPGLGDKVDLKKSDWVLGFDGKSITDPKPEQWKVKKDGGVFDQFTGATITPRAVTKAIFKALKYFEANKAILLEGENPAPANKAKGQ